MYIIVQYRGLRRMYYTAQGTWEFTVFNAIVYQSRAEADTACNALKAEYPNAKVERL